MRRSGWWRSALGVCLAAAGLAAGAAEPGFVPIFDGRTLRNWRATNMACWSVREGAITAGAQTPISNHCYLVWQGGLPLDFELKLRFRILGSPQANSGIQFRSVVRPDGFVEGYQADIARYPQHAGILYDETPGRGVLAERGQRVTLDERGNRTAVRFADPSLLWRRLNLDDWNEYHLKARGRTLSGAINGFDFWEVTDLVPSRRADSPGVLALQLHSGPAMTVQFKDILLKDPTLPPPPPPFFALCMDTHDARKRTLEQQAELLRELGYDGAGHLWLDQLAERLRTLDAAGLELYQVYLRLDLAAGAKEPFDTRLVGALPLLKGRPTTLAVLVSGGKPSDAALDGRAVELLRQMADLAQPFGVRLVLYPHTADWLEGFEDAVRVAGKAERANLGVMFNLCHWLRTDPQRDYRAVLQKGLSRLWVVTLNGADERDPQPGWSRYIQPLDSGSFDVRRFLTTLREIGFTGPVGLQCYGLGGDAREHLARSVTAWQRFQKPAAPADPGAGRRP